MEIVDWRSYAPGPGLTCAELDDSREADPNLHEA